MGLISFVLLFIITAVYLNNYITKKPEFINSLVSKVQENMAPLVKWGALYAVLASVVSLFSMTAFCCGISCVLKLLANLMILVMLSPALVETYSGKIKEMFGEKAVTISGLAVKFLKKQEKYIGYAGAIVCIMLFVSI